MEPDLAVGVGAEFAAQVHEGLLGILLLIESHGRGLPDVDLGVRHRLPVYVLDGQAREHLRPGRRGAQDRAAILDDRLVQAPEGTEQVLRGAVLAHVAIVHQADQLGHAHGAAHQHHLVVGVVGLLAQLDQQGGGGPVLDLGQPGLAHEGVQMLGQGDHDLAQARIAGAAHHLQHRGGDVVGTADDHWLTSPALRALGFGYGYSGAAASARSRDSQATAGSTSRSSRNTAPICRV